ncbi:unnamed protein product [Cunninghamella echinulata]
MSFYSLWSNFSIFFLFIARNAQHVLLTVASAFFCLIALLISSVIWYLAKDVQAIQTISIIYSVAIQELFRWFYFLLIQRTEPVLNLVTKYPKSPFNQFIFAFVAGYGYALTTSLVSYISLLVQSIGPGIIVCPSCPNASIFFISAVTTTLFSLLHMVWMTIAFDGYASKSWIGYIKIIWVIISHYGASYGVSRLFSYCSGMFQKKKKRKGKNIDGKNFKKKLRWTPLSFFYFIF